MNGWFKFHRKIFDNPVCNKDSQYFHVWCWILANAKFEEERVLWKGKDIILQKGQFITTTREIAEKLNIDESKVRRILKKLENDKQIDRQTSTKNALITVLNWDFYQGSDGQNDGRVTDKRQTSDGQVTDKRQTFLLYKELKKERTEELKKTEEVITTEAEDVKHSEIQATLEVWNELQVYGIKPVSKLKSGTERYERLSARIREYGVADVLSAIENIKKSDFLQGKNNRGWTITFDWFVRPNNFPKVLDGNYINDSKQENNKTNINVSKKSQLDYLLNSIREEEMNGHA